VKPMVKMRIPPSSAIPSSPRIAERGSIKKTSPFVPSFPLTCGRAIGWDFFFVTPAKAESRPGSVWIDAARHLRTPACAE